MYPADEGRFCVHTQPPQWTPTNEGRLWCTMNTYLTQLHVLLFTTGGKYILASYMSPTTCIISPSPPPYVFYYGVTQSW